MKHWLSWHRRLRGKLFLSHFLISMVIVVLHVGVASLMADFSLRLAAPLSLEGSAPAAAAPADGTAPAAATGGLQRQNFLLVMRDALIVATVAALEAALLLSLSISNRIVQPIQVLSKVSKRLARGFYHERITIQSDDELAELGNSVNQLAAALEQTERRRMALISDVAHELRTPLATIGGYMEGVLDGVVKPDRETFTLVLNESQRLQRLIEDLQTLSQAEAGQIPIMTQPVDIRSVLRRIGRQYDPLFAALHVDLVLAVPESLPFAWADIDRTSQVVINLLSNAQRYTPAGGQVTLRAYHTETQLVVVVEDTGVGIAPEHLDRLFERFYRVDKSRARASGGSGIGLTIARYLIDAQQGELWVHSDGIGHGAQVGFSLPRTTPDDSLREVRRTQRSSKASAAP